MTESKSESECDKKRNREKLRKSKEKYWVWESNLVLNKFLLFFFACRLILTFDSIHAGRFDQMTLIIFDILLDVM